MLKVSVIIPVYNAERFLEETIRSVLQQTMTDFELILVNDGSTDGSLKMIHSFLTDKRVLLIDQKNSGVCAARNAGSEKATGEYIAFLDADDAWLENNLAEKVNVLEKSSQAVLVHATVENINAGGKKTGTNTGKEGNVLSDLLLWNGTVVPGPSSALIRRKAFNEINGFDTELSTAADQDLFIRLAALGSFIRIDHVLSKYRFHSDNMHSNIALMERDHLLVYRKAEKRNAFVSSRFRRKCFSNLYLVLAGSWWVNGKNKRRGFLFILKSIFIYPPHVLKVLSKLK